MNEGSDTWVIVLAALSGGLIGSISQPVLGYVLDRFRAGESEAKRRQRRLRRMVEAWITYGSEVALTATILRDMRRSNLSFTPEERTRILSSKSPEMWLGRRIKDTALRQKSDRYHGGLLNLSVMIWDPKFDDRKLTALIEALAILQGEIIDLMDDLNWPEVDD